MPAKIIGLFYNDRQAADTKCATNALNVRCQAPAKHPVKYYYDAGKTGSRVTCTQSALLGT